MKSTDDFFFEKAEQEWLAPPEKIENNFYGSGKTSLREHCINKATQKNK